MTKTHRITAMDRSDCPDGTPRHIVRVEIVDAVTGTVVEICEQQVLSADPAEVKTIIENLFLVNLRENAPHTLGDLHLPIDDIPEPEPPAEEPEPDPLGV